MKRSWVKKVVNWILKPFGVKLVRLRRPSNFPTIFLAALPKSGSAFISKTLARALGSRRVNSSGGYYPAALLNIKLLERTLGGGYVLNSHIDPSPININVIRELVDRLNVHFRDPRQHLLSLVHHMNQLHQKFPRKLLRWNPPPPAEYFNWEINRQIDWQMANFYSKAIDWMSRWVDAEQNELAGRVRITEYSDFLSDNRQFVRDILEFFGIDPESVTIPETEKKESPHYRKADPKEWTSVFSAEQIEQATGLIPESLRQRFNWVD